MNEWLLSLCRQIENSSGSIALHESLYLYSLIETTHVLAIGLFVGLLFMLDFRLLGWSFSSLPITDMCKKVLPYSLLGFVVMIITGALLFYAIPVRTYQSIFFRIKITLFIIAGINALIFHVRARKGNYAGDISTATRLAAGISLLTWSGVIVAGRMIAYNWFDCEKLTPHNILFGLSGCDVSF